MPKTKKRKHHTHEFFNSLLGVKLGSVGIYRFLSYIWVRSKGYIFSRDLKKLVVPMSAQRLSNKEFQVFLHALFENDSLKVKYQNPDAWRGYYLIK